MPTKSADEKHDKTAPSKVKAAPKAKPLDEAESFAEQLKAVRLAVAEARVIAEETAGDDDAMQRALARMVQSHLFVIMQKLVVV
ncbi:MAG: hypothetical protein WBE78_16760, partial [Candidatus Binataceae bacterium]